MSYFLLIVFALSPSLIWLIFFLRKDSHPESNRMVLRIFLYGALAAIPAIFLELGAFQEFKKLPLSPFLITILNVFIGVALIEEVLKYLVVKKKVISNSEFDEPVDAMLYMIISALGFAAFENFLIFFSLAPTFIVQGALALSAFRFVGATLLHALCSGLVGYFLALSFFEIKKGERLIFLGLGIAILLHSLFNFSIMMTEGDIRFIVPVIILIGLALAVSLGFKKLKKMASVCKIQ